MTDKVCRGNRSGFTIIELLTVVVIIGVLASIAIPKFRQLKERAQVASMVSDLRNLVGAQESFFASHGDYAGGIANGPDLPGLGGAGRVAFAPSPGVVLTLTYHSSAGVGWSAVATHPAITNSSSDECAIYLGSPTFAPNAAVLDSGRPFCY